MPEQRYRNRSNGKYGTVPVEYAHVQPQAIEVEMAVLGALMIDRDAYMEVCDKLAMILNAYISMIENIFVNLPKILI